MDYSSLGGEPFSGADGRVVSEYLGHWTIINTPVDALPDLSDVQVIIKTSYPGQAPQIVENQVTYPLTTTMLSVPARRLCAVSRSLATLMCMSFSKMAPIHTGRARGCWSTSTGTG